MSRPDITMNRATGIRELLETVNENVIAMAIRIRRNALTRFKSYVIDRVLDKSQRKWDSFGTGVVARLVIEIEKTGIASLKRSIRALEREVRAIVQFARILLHARKRDRELRNICLANAVSIYAKPEFVTYKRGETPFALCTAAVTNYAILMRCDSGREPLLLMTSHLPYWKYSSDGIQDRSAEALRIYRRGKKIFYLLVKSIAS